jgi:hypothetical protein
MSLKYEKAYRQGEILIFKVKSLKGIRVPMPYGYKAFKVENGVIREGEKEGHEHKLDGNGQLTLFSASKEDIEKKQADTGVIEVLEKTATLSHPEHADIKLPKGEYVMKVQKEAVGKNKSQSVKD